MCLERKDKITRVKDSGYKIVSIVGSKMHPVYNGKRKLYKLNEWITDTRKRKIEAAWGGFKYAPGFHIFVFKKDALRWKGLHCFSNGAIFRVKCRQVVASGYDHYRSFPILVAKEMMLLKKFR